MGNSSFINLIISFQHIIRLSSHRHLHLHRNAANRAEPHIMTGGGRRKVCWAIDQNRTIWSQRSSKSAQLSLLPGFLIVAAESTSSALPLLEWHSMAIERKGWGGGVDYFEIESQNVEREPLKPGNMSYNLPRAINDWWKLSGSRRNHKAQDTYDSIIHISFTHSGTPPGVPPACFSLISHSTQCFYAFICKYINFSIIFCLILFLFYSHISLEPPTISRTAKPPIRAHLHQEPPSSGDLASSSNVK